MNTLIGFLEAGRRRDIPTTKAGEVMKKELTRAIRRRSSRRRIQPETPAVPSSTTRTRRENRPRSHPEDLPTNPHCRRTDPQKYWNRQHNCPVSIEMPLLDQHSIVYDGHRYLIFARGSTESTQVNDP